MSIAEQNEKFYLSAKGKKAYKGIQIFAVNGLHEKMIDTVLKELPPNSKVLDVGCGRGAFSLRLYDNGYKVDACDKIDQCECKDKVNFINVSAEEFLFDEKKYDAIFMIEIIEHVESPFSLIKQYYKYLKKDGILYITSPSLESLYSRAWFFLSGRHWYFEDENLINDGHIMPVHKFQMHYIAGELNADLTYEDCFESRNPRLGIFWAALKFLKLYEFFKRKKYKSGPVTMYRLSPSKN